MSAPDFSEHFSVWNIPFGIASSESHNPAQVVTRIGNSVIFVFDLATSGLFSEINGLDSGIFQRSSLNEFASYPKWTRVAVRETIQRSFGAKGLSGFPEGSTEDISAVTLHLPIQPGDFIDYSCSLEHVRNAGRIVAKSDRLPPGFFNFPIGYHGRASSIYVSGTNIERPCGHYYSGNGTGKDLVHGPSQALDYEVELAMIVGSPVEAGVGVPAVSADKHIFGFVIMNDWSARDIQSVEMPPLGPFNGKSFGTSISPWVITQEALEPFMVKSKPKTLPTADYIADPDNWSYSIQMQVELLTDGAPPTIIGRSNVSSLYWNVRQMIAHAVSSGSPLRTGDILATGTVSEPGRGQRGCLLETTEGGLEPVILSDGTSRKYLEDLDIVRMTAIAGEPSSGVGFGACLGRVLPSRQS
uniref:Fumarylacetoacetase n=1 Tax=Bionectria ochroleuca TaxID=29856 RepID=A0A8H7NL73_BIOOC